MTDGALPDRLWYGARAADRAARALLAPFAAAYGAVVAVRGAMYDARGGTVGATRVPCVSIGNLSVGGTGKTPVAAWYAGTLLARGARPAIVLRGYGDDEPLVHARINPGVPVVVDPDRVRGAARAAASGADVVVLDDAFQHRRVARSVDVVLVSADRWPDRVRLLPSGPFREPLSALRRATLVIITRKAADAATVERVRGAVSASAPGVPIAVVELALDALRGAGELVRPIGDLRGASVFAVSAIGDPGAFAAQLIARGARAQMHGFRDHHAFSARDVGSLVAASAGFDLVLCTLKDHVKLAPLWPRQAPTLWYVSQQPIVRDGGDALEASLASLLRARPHHS